jgi:xanthine dehydrogenase molybdenum-binding subunit
LVVIDRATGDIDEVVAVHDVGRAVNPLLVEGQVEGSVHMGLGYALSEDFPADPETAMPTATTLRQLGILRAGDMPRVRVRLVEVPDTKNTWPASGPSIHWKVPSVSRSAPPIQPTSFNLLRRKLCSSSDVMFARYPLSPLRVRLDVLLVHSSFVWVSPAELS